MRMSPRYSFAPSPRPLLATGDAHRTLDLAAMLRMMAPGCSDCEFPALYKASETHAQLNPLSRHDQASSTSASPWSERCRMLAMVVMVTSSAISNPWMTATFSSTPDVPTTLIMKDPPTASIAAWASSFVRTATMTSRPTDRAASASFVTSSTPDSNSKSRMTAFAPMAADWAIWTSSTITSLLMTGTGPGTSFEARRCSSTKAAMSA
mmetsp:Transcript_3617/g.7909  ORF Transcript_3617/g.7909 Transcript_3617/m.7909 type:complete len:208 (-) Transcript_3617:906-1529(-)